MTGSGAAGGFNLQALVGAYVATSLLGRTRLGWTGEVDIPAGIAFEQGGAGDDLRVEFGAAAGTYEVQVKRGLGADTRLEAALGHFVSRLKDGEQGILVVDPTSSRPVTESLPRWLDRRREGVAPPLPTSLTKRCAALLLPEAEEIVRKLFVVVLDLEHSSSAHRLLAERILGERLRERESANGALMVLAQEAHRLSAQRGKLNERAAEKLVEAAGCSLRPHVPQLRTRQLGLPPRTPRFAGRRAEVARLRDLLSGGRPERIAIIGVPGSGKSTLAAEFVHGIETGFGAVLWHDATTATTLATDIHSHTRDLETTRPEPPPLLVVLDNAPMQAEQSFQVLEAYDKFGSVSLLITSKHSSWTESCQTLSLGRLARETSLELLRQVSATAEPGELESLAIEVDDFPLAVAQLCTYARKTLVPWESVLARLRARGPSLFAASSADLTYYEQSAATCWLLVLEQLSERAADLLEALSFFDCREIPLNLWADWQTKRPSYGRMSEDEFDDAVSELTEWCLLTRSGSSVECHGLQQRVVRELLDAEKAEAQATNIAEMLRAVLGSAPQGASFQHYLRLRRHLYFFLNTASDLIQPEPRAAMFQLFGNYLGRDENDFDAVLCFREAVALARSAGPEASGFLASALNSLGVSERRLGQLDEAQVHLEEALGLVATSERETLRAAVLDNIGQVAQSRGDLDVALRRYEEALALRGGDEAATGEAANSLCNILRVLLDKGENEAARPRLDRLVQNLGRVAPGENPWLPDICASVAGYLEEVSEPRTADLLMLASVSHARTVFGHESIAYLAHALGSLAFLARASDPEMACWFLERGVRECPPDPRLGFLDLGPPLRGTLLALLWFNGSNLLVAWGHPSEGYGFLRSFCDTVTTDGTGPEVAAMLQTAQHLLDDAERTDAPPWPMAFFLPPGVPVPLPAETPPPEAAGTGLFERGDERG